MNTKSQRYLRRVTLLAALGVAGLFLAPVSAFADAPQPQKLTLDYSKGKCGQTTIMARSGVPTTLEINTSDNFTDDARIEMQGNRVNLPDTYKPVTTQVDLGVPGPGAIPFKVSGSEWPGSVGTGCEGYIIIA
ncbi:hypothetical protein [Nocardia yamanashiensis]|uniref:hypothetical protein n=1 Tax=Nocardia yamanashiensis TaxID=209247 RepID=UPI0008303211|nr:hypothetical protein [Nocardia yamanashiensis]